MTLEELASAVAHHRRQMAPLVSGSAELDHTCAELVGVLARSDRELGRLYGRLARHVGRIEEPTGQQEPWT